MSAVLAWARLDARRRGRSLLVLVLLVTVSSGVVLTMLAGARRTNSAIPRLLDRTLPADVMVLPNKPGFDWGPVSRLPSVETLGTFALVWGAQLDLFDFQSTGFPAANASQNVTVDRPVLLRGRFPDTNNPLEALGSDGFVKKYGAYATVRLPSEAQAAHVGIGDSFPPGTKMLGQVVRIHVVGEGRNTFGLALNGVTFEPSYAFFHDYLQPLLPYFVNARVRLHGGRAAIPQFRKELAAATHNPNIDVVDEAEDTATEQRSASVVGTGWTLFSVFALLASLVLVGQALARYCNAAGDELRTMGALGMDRRQCRLAAAAGPAIAGLLGAAGGGVIAAVGSPFFPTGVARKLEPTPGVLLDPLVMVGGAALLGAVVVLGTWWATRRLGEREGATATDRPSAVAAAAARAGLGLVAVLGTRFALEPGRGRTRVPVRQALLGAVVGVLGVVAALTFRVGLDGTVSDPARFGQTLPNLVDVAMGAPSPDDLAIVRKAAASPDIAVMNDQRVGVLAVNGRQVSTFSLSPLKGEVKVVALSGRPPARDDEISLGPQTAAGLHVTTGDMVRVGQRTLRVSGITFVPEDSHNPYSDGAWLTGAGFAVQQPDQSKDKFREVRFAWAPGVDPAAATKRLGFFGENIQPAFVPQQLTDLRSVRLQPLLLGAFLLLLALGAVGHTLSTAVRRRRHDVAVLRSLGMTRRQSRLTVATQASVLACVGLLFGLPLGLAAGRTGWRLVAHSTPALYVAPLAVLVLVVAVPVTLALANLLAALPARRAALLDVGQILRAE